MASRFHVRLMLGGMALVACGGDSGSLDPTSYSYAGERYWEEILVDQAVGVECFDSGMLQVTQNGNAFTAVGDVTGDCTGPGGSFPISTQTQLVSGVFDGTGVRFSVDGCRYSGTAHGEAPDSITGHATCTVSDNGITLHLRSSWRLLRSRPDLTPPSVTGALSGSSAPPAIPNGILLRDTLRIATQASDDQGLTWVGYALSGSVSTRDSVTVSGGAASPLFPVVITPAMVGSVGVTVFARDLAGNRTETPLGALTVKNIRSVPAVMLTLTGPVADLVHDGARKRLYLSIAGTTTVAVVDLTTRTVLPSLTLPGNAAGLDLSLSGDSLIVALNNRSALAVVNLQSGQTDTVHIPFSTAGSPLVAGALRGTANGKVLITGTTPGSSGNGGQLAVFDPATGAVTIRTDVGTNGAIDFRAELARPGSRSPVVLVETGGCCPIKAYVYNPATDALGGPIGTLQVFPREVQASFTGTRFLLATTVFDQGLAAIGTYTDPDFQPGLPTALGADGGTVILGGTPVSLPGLMVQSVATHQTLDRVYVPGWGPMSSPDDRIRALPDGHSLVLYQGPFAWSGGSSTKLLLVDLAP